MPRWLSSQRHIGISDQQHSYRCGKKWRSISDRILAARDNPGRCDFQRLIMLVGFLFSGANGRSWEVRTEGRVREEVTGLCVSHLCDGAQNGEDIMLVQGSEMG